MVPINYEGPFIGKMFLFIIDAHSKWLDVHCVNSATTETTIEKLRATFATHGLPEMIVSDNGSVFTSGEFKVFMQKNGIRHVTSALYHPSLNGRADFQARDEEAREREHRDKAHTFSVELPYNASDNYRGITRSTTTGPQPEVTSGSVKPKCWNES